MHKMAMFLVCLAVCAAVAGTADIVCDGAYKDHLQGVATDGKHLFWSFTTELVKTDLRGRKLAVVPVAYHHGDLCVSDGIVYVAVNLGGFNQLNAGRSEVRAYSAADLSPMGKWALPDMKYGAGGMTAADGHFFVVGGLPATVEYNPVFEYDREFRLVRRHDLQTGYTFLGIQTAAFEDGRFLFGIYGAAGCPMGVLECPRDLDSFVRYCGTGNVGIIKLGGEFWTALVEKDPVGGGQKGRLVRMPGYPACGGLGEKNTKGRGRLVVFYAERDRAGWSDSGYELRDSGYHPLFSPKEKVFVSARDAAKVTELPAVRLGDGRRFSTPDLVRGVRRAAAKGETLALVFPGRPETLAEDEPAIAAARDAVLAEAKRLGVAVQDGAAK